jgi:hypothetical protein
MMSFTFVGQFQGGSNLNNFPHNIDTKFTVSAKLRALAPLTTVNVSAVSLGLAGQSAGPIDLAATVTTLVSGASVKPVAPEMEILNVAKATTPSAPTAELKSVTFDLVRTTGSSLASNVGPQDFTNPSNAEGINLATSATVAGGGVSNKNVTLQLAYEDPTGKDELDVTAVTADFYYAIDNLTAGTMTARTRATWSGGSYDSGSSGTPVTYSSTPLSVDLFALGCDSWPKLRSLTTFVDVFTQAVASATRTGSVQAVAIIVAANKTDIL